MKNINKNKIFKIVSAIALILLPLIIEILNFKTIDFSKNMIIRTGIIYGLYIIIILYKVVNKYFNNKINIVVKKIIKYRYYIAIVIFVLMVIFKINFSSLDIWIQYLNEDTKNTSTLIGYPRAIRSDEWLVDTPLMLAQTENDDWYAQYNDNVSQGNYNMMINRLPVANLTIISHPLQWGFLLFGAEYGYSWYWSMKMILLILVSIELVMIVTNKDELLSLAGGIFIGLAPCMVWWLSTSVVEAYIFGASIIVLFNKYIENIENYKIKMKVLIAFGMIIVIPAFAMTLYPAYQIPLAYLIFAFLLIIFITNIKKIKKIDYIIMAVTLIIALLIIVYFIIVSWNDILIEINTVYPGARFETGGQLNISNLVQYCINLFLPINTTVPYSNASEISTYIYPFVGTIILLIYTLTNTEFRVKDNKLLISLTIVFIFMFWWCYIGFNDIMAKITFLYTSQASRTNLVLGLAGALLSLLLIKKHENKKIFNKSQTIILSTIITIVTYIVLKNSIYYSYFSIIKLEIALLTVFALTYSLLSINKNCYCFIIIIIALVSGATVNPIVSGIKIFNESEIYSEIQKIEQSDEGALWIGNSNISGQFLMATGIKVLNGINVYPNFDWLNIVDSEKKFEEVYNRYAHISIELGEETYFELIQPDFYVATLTSKDIENLGIKYVFSLQEYDQKIVEQFKLKAMYMNKDKNQYIYKFE